MTEKSTNVRPNKSSPLLRGMALLDRWFGPDAAAWLAARLFFRARKQPRPAREAAWLGDAVRFAVRGARPLVAWSWGETGRPIVLLVHGWEGRGAQLGGFVAPLLAAGFRVVAYDAPAHGESRGRESTVPEAAQAIADVIDSVGPVTAIVAHSLGAAATTLALSRGVSADRVVYLAPMVAVAEAVRRFAGFLALSPAATSAFAARVERRAGAPMAAIEGETLGRELRMPLLVVHDHDDREVPLADAERLVRVWRGARLVRTRELGHRRILRDEARISEAVDFLAQGAEVIPLGNLLDR
jgi:pimeloyl-ACP methyl ester carboxylesterase